MEINATMILQIFIFVALLLWLSRMLFAPILRLFDERERRILGSIEEAKTLSLLADEKAQTFDEQYQKARDKAREALSAMKLGIDKEHREVIDQAKLLAKAKIERAQTEMLLEEDQARIELAKSSDMLAELMVQALLKKA